MARLLHSQDATNPRYHLVGRRVGWLVQVDEGRPTRKEEHGFCFTSGSAKGSLLHINRLAIGTQEANDLNIIKLQMATWLMRKLLNSRW